MRRIKLIANLSCETARMIMRNDYEKFLTKNNDAKNWIDSQKHAIIINNAKSKDSKSVNIENVGKSNINSLILNNNYRNDDGHLHAINIIIYTDDESIMVSDDKLSEFIYDEYFVSNVHSQGLFKNIKIENPNVIMDTISNIEFISELYKQKISSYCMAKLLKRDELCENLECIDRISRIEIENPALSEEDFLTKYKTELDENIELSREVERIFNTKNDYAVQYVSYYFENRNIYNNNIKLLAEALYVAKRIKKNEYYEMNLNIPVINIVSNLKFFGQLMSMTNGLFVHFNINYSYNEFKVKQIINVQEGQSQGVDLKNVISEIKKMQYSTICSFSIDVEDLGHKNFIKDVIYDLFRIVPFYNELNEQQALDYTTARLKDIGLTALEARVRNIVKNECDKNDCGLSKIDVDEIIYDVQRRLASSIYEKEYASVDIELEQVVGLNEFKKEFERIKNSIEISYKNDNLSIGQTNRAIMNMCYRFEGGAGVGKTYASKILANYLYRAGITSSNTIFRFFSINDVLSNIESIMGKYKNDDMNSYIDNNAYDVMLIESMENTTPSDLRNFLSKLNEVKKNNLVILCGSRKDFRKLDEGVADFKSKFPRTIKFYQYSVNELIDILIQQVKAKKYEISESAIKLVHEQFEKVVKVPNFSNAIFVEDYAEHIINNSLNRVFNNNVESEMKTDAYLIIDSDIENVDMVALLGSDYKTLETYENAMNELDKLIGLTSVKNYIRSYIAKSKIDKMKKDCGYTLDEGLNMHLCFTGNPGTAKTTVARQFAKILYSNGIITKPDIVECGLSDLQGEYLGQTSPKVIEKFEEAKGGVIFIDEAYSLNNDDVYSKQTVDTIVEQMENHRDEVIVIFAGYKEPMEAFIKSNPGIKGRVSRFLEFPDYDIEELMQIFDKIIADKKYVLEDEINIKTYVRNFLVEKMNKEDFANGRDVRLIIENAVLNQSMRLYNENITDTMNKDVLMTLKYEDFVDEAKEFYKEKNKIGFMA